LPPSGFCRGTGFFGDVGLKAGKDAGQDGTQRPNDEGVANLAPEDWSDPADA
jgi:hypothetical protein